MNRTSVQPSLSVPLTLAVLAAASIGLGAARPALAGIVPIGGPERISETQAGVEPDPRLCARPDGGFLALWRGEDPPTALQARLLDPSAAPSGDPILVSPAATEALWPNLACLADGGGLIVWAAPAAAADFSLTTILARRLGPDGVPTGDPVQVSETAGSNRTPDLSCGPAECVVGWSRFSPEENVTVARRIALSGVPMGSEIPIGGGSPLVDPEVSVAMHPDGGFAAVSSERGGRRLFAHRFGGPGGFLVSSFLAVETVKPEGGIYSPQMAVGAGDVFFAAWEERDPFTVGEVRGALIGPSRAKVPSFPLDDFSEYQGTEPEVAVDGFGSFLAAWRGTDAITPDRILARGFDSAGAPTGPAVVLAHDVQGGPDSAPRPDGSFAVAWEAFDHETPGRYVAARLARIEQPPPPPGPWLGTPELPGFQVKVRITAGELSIAGALETECAAETLCASGAVPGRSEVFVRVVGPKPNGRLWPAVIKFSTSTVEVWLEQLASGEVRYYKLPGATRGVNDLPGVFDREGFAP